MTLESLYKFALEENQRLQEELDSSLRLLNHLEKENTSLRMLLRIQ